MCVVRACVRTCMRAYTYTQEHTRKQCSLFGHGLVDVRGQGREAVREHLQQLPAEHQGHALGEHCVCGCEREGLVQEERGRGICMNTRTKTLTVIHEGPASLHTPSTDGLLQEALVGFRLGFGVEAGGRRDLRGCLGVRESVCVCTCMCVHACMCAHVHAEGRCVSRGGDQSRGRSACVRVQHTCCSWAGKSAILVIVCLNYLGHIHQLAFALCYSTLIQRAVVSSALPQPLMPHSPSSPAVTQAACTCL